MIQLDHTPNPNAMKFTVGKAVGGPATFLAGQTTDQEWVQDLLDLPGVSNIFLTADFVTISKTAEGDWEQILPMASEIISAHFA